MAILFDEILSKGIRAGQIPRESSNLEHGIVIPQTS